jgi:NADPH:quinone reductase
MRDKDWRTPGGFLCGDDSDQHKEDIMKSYWIRTEGDKTALEFRDVPRPQPKRGEIVLRVHATSLNRGEFIADHGLHSADAPKPAGVEAAGEVHVIGEGVAGVKPGDRIMGRARGAFAEYALMDASQAIPVPERLSWEQAAAALIGFQTSYDILYPYGKLKPGEWLLVTGASAGVGVACIQTAKFIGAKVIGTSGSAEKLAKLKTIGLDFGIHTRKADFAARVKEATDGKGANLIVNNVGGSVFAECVRSLAYRGRLATVGYIDGILKSEIDLEALHSNRLELFGVSNKRSTPAMRARTVRDFVRDVVPAFADGRIVPVIDRVFSFEDLPVAKQHMESNAHVGKIVVRMH